MASVTLQRIRKAVKQGGRETVRETLRAVFYDRNHKRRSLRLGKLGAKSAESIRYHVERLADLAAAALPLDSESSAWLDKIGRKSKLANQLVGLGLIARIESATLGEFTDSYIKSRAELAANSVRNLRYTRGKLVKHFGEARDLRAITTTHADEFRKWLLDEGYAAAVASKSVRTARQFFAVALRRGLVKTNPFIDVRAGGERNEARLLFIDRPTIARVLDACPDDEWRLIVVLSRFGGLRTPSETLGLKWTDVDWENGKLTIDSPKTARQGKPFRVVPLFPEIRPFLERAFDLAPEGATSVVRRYSDKNQNLRTEFMRIIKRAGIDDVWPRLFHNLRASRQTELTDQFPNHVVARWLGNSVKTAERHYLSTTDEHFRRAASGSATIVAEPAATSAEVSTGAVAQLGVAQGVAQGRRRKRPGWSNCRRCTGTHKPGASC